MNIKKFKHSCFVVESGEARLLFDPGAYSFSIGGIKPSEIGTIDAIFITHRHADHLDLKALEFFTNIPIYTDHETITELAKVGIKGEIFESGHVRIKHTKVEAYTAPHEKILAPCPTNIAYFVETKFLHAGDSLSASLARLKPVVLAYPVIAPWMTEIEGFNFAKLLNPKYILPSHDGLVTDFFRKSKHQQLKEFFAKEGIEFISQGNGDLIEFEI